jgi:hypothetical protein
MITIGGSGCRIDHAETLSAIKALPVDSPDVFVLSYQVKFNSSIMAFSPMPPQTSAVSMHQSILFLKLSM